MSNSAGSRSLQQLAFAQLLSRRLLGLVTQPAAYDPVFTRSDKHLLTACGFQVCQAAMLCKSGSSTAPAHMQPACSLLCMQVVDAQVCHQSADGHTLFFMPHCERQAFEDVLAANWEPDRLPKVAILGETLWQRALEQSLAVLFHFPSEALSCNSQIVQVQATASDSMRSSNMFISSSLQMP